MKILKVRRDVLIAATHHYNQNAARYYFALRMRCTYQHPDGSTRQSERCGLEDVKQVEKLLERRDGKIAIQRLLKMGWIRDGRNGYYYFTSQDKIAREYQGDAPISHQTIEVELDKLGGNVVAVRAYFYSLTLAGMSDNNTFTRGTIKDVTGHTPRTQRKYEKVEGLQHEENIGLLPNDLIKPTKGPIFETLDAEGGLRFARQHL